MTALDTNVLIYACDRSDPRRQEIALDLIARATDGILLWQVACEFIAASRKLKDQGFTPTDAWNRQMDFLGVLRLALPSADVFPRAQDFHLNHSVSFWDAMIVAACLEGDIATLYSEVIRRFVNETIGRQFRRLLVEAGSGDVSIEAETGFRDPTLSALMMVT